MDRERWQAIKRVLEQASEVPEEEREAFLDRACDSDDNFRNDVESFLKADTSQVDFLDQACVRQEPETLEVGARIGAYQVIETIGRGGMGSVYRASRADGVFEREVAIKVLDRGRTLPFVTARFWAERRILADLDHSHIAKLFEGGSTETGCPYFVMEYVQGLPLTTHCERNQLSLRARLLLFQEVCRAVHVANQSRTIHCDLKPGNILVNRDGQVKLVDFGIAEFLGAATDHGGCSMFTPEYASPEQRQGKSLTTATDVYSLGRVLEELLDPESFGEESKAASATPSRSLSKKATPRSFRGLFNRDLVAIVRRCTQEDPPARYSSAEQIAEDIDRHLQAVPVLARRATLGYSTIRFATRHKWGVSLGILLLLLGLSFAGILMVQNARISNERDRAQLARDAAQRANAVSRQVVDFLVSTFDRSDPYTLPSLEVNSTLRDYLDRAAVLVEEDLSAAPQVRASLMTAMGRVYCHMGLFTKARSLLEPSLQIRSEGSIDPLSRAEVQRELGRLDYLQGRLRDAEQRFREAAEVRRSRLEPGHPQVLEVALDLAVLEMSRGNSESAEAHLEQVLANVSASNPSSLLAAVQYRLAELYGRQAHYRKALPLMESALDTSQAVFGVGHPRTATALHGLGLLRGLSGDLLGAEECLDQAVELMTEQLGANHPVVAGALHNLAGVYARMDELELARDLSMDALGIHEDHGLAMGPEAGALLLDLARVQMDLGDLHEAEESLRRSRSILEPMLGAAHPHRASLMLADSTLCRQKGELSKAEQLCKAALRLFATNLGEEHPDCLWAKLELAEIRILLDDREEARKLCQQVMETRGRHDLSEWDPLFVQAESMLGRLRRLPGPVSGTR